MGKADGKQSLQRKARKIFFHACAWGVVGACILAGAVEHRAVKSRVPPVYPEIAKRLHVTGQVKLEVKVDASGSVTEVKTVSGNHLLAVAAEEAVHRWKFVPADAGSTENIDVNFME